MRTIILLCLLFTLLACEKRRLESIKKRLIGTWVMKNNSGEIVFREEWKVDNYQFFGKGESVSDSSKSFVEYLFIEKYENGYAYVVRGVNDDDTYFRLDIQSGIEFYAYNEENEFPKVIHYKFKGDSLKVRAFNERDTLFFNFSRALKVDM